MRRAQYLAGMFAGAAAALAPHAAEACAVCGLGDSAYIWSYLFMTGVPLILMTLIGGVIYYHYRGKSKSLEPGEGAPLNYRREK